MCHTFQYFPNFYQDNFSNWCYAIGLINTTGTVAPFNFKVLVLLKTAFSRMR